MANRSYLVWFLSAVSLALLAVVAFNAIAERIILTHRAGPSIQTVSGFERVLKPAWLESIQPDVVFVGSSRIRDAFDPVLLDPAFHIRAFNYGISSATDYEVRRLVQDAAAHPSVKEIVVSLDAFTANPAPARTVSGFDELRLAVGPNGKPTEQRPLWLFTSRYLSGGALGMHALALYLLAQLHTGEDAAARPDIFEAYGHATEAVLAHDLIYRGKRTFAMNSWEHTELRNTFAAVCHKPVRLVVFFPPDNARIIDRYEANDGPGLAVFKRTVIADARAHNARCEGKIAVYDFMTANPITTSPMHNGQSDVYVDLVHVRPPVGVELYRMMRDPAGDLSR